MVLNKVSFKGQSLTRSFKRLIISPMYLLLHVLDGEKKLFLRQKIILLHMESVVLKLIILPFCDQVYSLVIFTISFPVEGWLITEDS